MFPEITISQDNLFQGEVKEIERTVLFIGVATDTTPPEMMGKTTPVNTKSDFIALFGDNVLTANLNAAMLNAGQNWFAYVHVLPDIFTETDFSAAIYKAQNVASVEGIVSTIPVTTKAEVEALASLRNGIIAKRSRWQWLAAPVVGLLPDELWPDAVARLDTLQKGIAAPGVSLIPLLFGNEIGVYAGRLCNRSVTIADSPMRVATGAVVELGSAEKPKDENGTELGLDTLIALEKSRYSVPCWYDDYDGVYWSDGRTLDVEGGDFQVIEYLRVIDKMARRIRLKAIPRIGNRSLNSTPASIAANKTYFARVMRDMSKSSQINGVAFPGELQPPKDGDVVITWQTKTKVDIYAVGRPYGCPKSIGIHIMLDLLLEDEK
ncbi:DUF2586 domain-containing protein [Limnobaculum xujianqingii]|uniref:DUF2586 domain-containing protein n=1 Tax=Limnobaculum xujianqingii TaxID=2738837 RepID=UPI0011296B4A|nr:DUF2586 domain-containing protein [Limnobaculum xujianqingii]